MNNNLPSAWIADTHDKGRKKIFPCDKIYMEDGKEFLIELFNPLKESVMAEIKINGAIATASGLVLKPGQRYFLDCFVDDKRKFLFKTYEVENSSEAKKAIEDNGFVEVSFYREKKYEKIYDGLLNQKTIYRDVIINNYPKYDYFYNPNTYDFQQFYCNTNSAVNIGTLATNCVFTNSAFNAESVSSNTIETGRVEKGEDSKQEFSNVNMNFESYTINTVKYQILPLSKKPIETSEIKTKNFCSVCGTKNKNYKYCPTCGEKI